MKPLTKDILFSFTMGFLLPGLLLGVGVQLMKKETEVQIPVQQMQQETLQETVALPMLLRAPGGAVEQMDLDTYLVGVVLAEMPAFFEEEALKAQAVVARTYTCKAYETGGKHGDGSVCSDPSCCQAYITRSDYLERGGTEEGLEKVEAAVEATSGQVLTYEGELIEATYFSCSGGSTEDAEAVWGTAYPYLKSVDSPGEEQAAPYEETLVFTLREFQNALGRILEGNPAHWFGLTTYTEGGGVAEMKICGETYTGTQLRSLLGLRSTAFHIEVGDTIQITTRGYGHRVGMSQYGADAMAVAGSSYETILAHYYQGAVLISLR